MRTEGSVRIDRPIDHCFAGLVESLVNEFDDETAGAMKGGHLRVGSTLVFKPTKPPTSEELQKLEEFRRMGEHEQRELLERLKDGSLDEPPGTFTVTAFEPGRKLALEHREGPMVMSMSFELVPEGWGTRLTQVSELKLRGVARLLSPFMRRFSSRLVGDAQESLAKLKRDLEKT